MAIIYTYNVALPEANDILLGTEKSATLRNPTKNFLIGDLAKFIIDSTNGTNLTLPLFLDVTDPVTGVTSTTLTDSILTQDANPGGAVVTVGGRMRVTGELDVDAGLADSTGKTGDAGMLLSSTGGGATLWVIPPGAGSGVYPFTTRLSFTIVHNGSWGPFPSATVVSSPNLVVVVGEVTYDSNIQLTIRFSAGFAGTVYLN